MQELELSDASRTYLVVVEFGIVRRVDAANVGEA
jgi:hypothetical protein